MKKAISVLMAFMLCMTLMAVGYEKAAHAETTAEDYDIRIDAVFAAGKIVLAEKDVPAPNPDSCAVIAPPRDLLTAAGKAFPDEVEIREILKTSPLTILAYSPDGKTAVGYVQSVEDSQQIPLIISGNQVRMIYPSPDRGAEGPYQTATDYYSRMYYNGYTEGNSKAQMPLGIDLQGLAWSPDGRYYYAPNYHYTAFFCRSNHFIVDTQTGELIALDSFSNSKDENYGILHAGCFSNDGAYFYGAYYGNKYGEPGQAKIIRYDLNSFEATVLADLGYEAVSMATLRNGDIMVLEWRPTIDDPQVFRRISPDGTTESSQYSFSMMVWYGKQIEYSPESGWAVIRGDSTLYGQYTTKPIAAPGIRIVRPDEAQESSPDSVWFIDNDTGELIYTPVMERCYTEDAEGNRDIRLFDNQPFEILDTELSPGGRYAAVLACRVRTEEVRLYVIRLEDQAYLVAEGLEIHEEHPGGFKFLKGQILDNYASGRGSNGYRPVLNWTKAGLITNCSKTQLWDIEE